MDEIEFHRAPPSNIPTLVTAFTGWIDAGEAATDALRFLVRQLVDQEPHRIGRGLPGIDPAAKRRHHRGHIGRGFAMKFDLVHAHPPRGKA